MHAILRPWITEIKSGSPGHVIASATGVIVVCGQKIALGRTGSWIRAQP